MKMWETLRGRQDSAAAPEEGRSAVLGESLFFRTLGRRASHFSSQVNSIAENGRLDTGFSLVELLTVIAILTIVGALLIPAMNNLGGAYAITRQGQLLNDQLALARQMATARNRDIELRFFEFSASSGTNWAVQLWQLDPAGQPASAAARRVAFPDSLIINVSLSPLLSSLTPAGEGDQSWRALRFRPNGRIAGQITTTNNYLTVQRRTEDSSSPRNYYTLQINPITGRVSTYRP